MTDQIYPPLHNLLCEIDSIKNYGFDSEMTTTIMRALAPCLQRGDITDGYHTFAELYRERSALTAALARIFQQEENINAYERGNGRPETIAWVGHDDSVGMDGFRSVLYIKLPDIGQVSWHFSDDDATEFLKKLPRKSGGAFDYDGHDTPTKYARVEGFARG